MTIEARETAATACPGCQVRTLPDPSLYSVVALYRCDTCGSEWSARLRNGRPDMRLYPASLLANVTDAQSIPSPLR